MFIIRHRKLIYAIIVAVIVISIGSVAMFGLTPSIDFTGGTLVEINYPAGRPDKGALDTALAPLSLGEYSLRASGDNGFLLRMKTLDQNTIEQVKQAMSENGTLKTEVVRSATVGPTIGSELTNKAWVATLLVILIIIGYITFAFRKVSKPVSSWMYGVITVLVLFHDLLIPIGLFAILGHVLGAEVDVLFVVAVLTILGYSVNDTIVVFDRVRENLRRNEESGVEQPFDELVGAALMQTMARSINTSMTTFLGILALLIFGSEVTRYFALTLLAGVVAGTYSSILLASPLLVTIKEWREARLARLAALAPASAPVTSTPSTGGGKKKHKRAKA
jgi:preprotein translocase subunit SecF